MHKDAVHASFTIHAFLFSFFVVLSSLPHSRQRLPDILHQPVDKRSGSEADGNQLRRQQHQRGNNHDAIGPDFLNHAFVGTMSPRLEGACKSRLASVRVVFVLLWLFVVQGIIVIVFPSPPIIIITIVTVGRRLSKWVGTATGESLRTAAAAAAAEVEVGTARETSGTTGEPPGTVEASTAAAKASLLAHHAEQDFGIDAAHAATHTAATEHVVGV